MYSRSWATTVCSDQRAKWVDIEVQRPPQGIRGVVGHRALLLVAIERVIDSSGGGGMRQLFGLWIQGLEIRFKKSASDALRIYGLASTMGAEVGSKSTD